MSLNHAWTPSPLYKIENKDRYVELKLIQLRFYSLSQDIFAKYFLKLFHIYIIPLDSNNIHLNSMKKSQDYPFETPPLACTVTIHG